MVSVIIPSRNERFTTKTVQDLLNKATGEIEIIVVLDGWWLPVDEIIEDDRVHYVHYGEARGMRNAINAGVALAKGEYILKCDAHTMFDKGFDTVLANDCQDNWVVVPRRYALEPETWRRVEGNPKYPVDYMYLSKDLHGREWSQKNADPKLKEILIDDLMSFQGSAWFMKKSYFEELELMDEESFGTFYAEAQEIGFKAWLSGGRVVVNKKTWYAHWHKPKDVGRGYSLDKDQAHKGAQCVLRWVNERVWHKQSLDFQTMLDKFGEVPEH